MKSKAVVIWRWCIGRLEKTEAWILGPGRLVLLIVGLLLIVAAGYVVVSGNDDGRGRNATLLAGVGAATWALWTTAARVKVTREGAQGALLAQILQRYHSDEMWAALEKLGRVDRGIPRIPEEDAAFRFFPFMMSTESMNSLLLDVYGGSLGQAWNTFDQNRRLVSAFFVTVHRLCSGGSLPTGTAVNAIGESGVCLYVDFVRFVDMAFANGRGLRVDSTPVSFFATMLGHAVGRGKPVGHNPYMPSWPPDLTPPAAHAGSLL